jgi:hypothetical protein
MRHVMMSLLFAAAMAVAGCGGSSSGSDGCRGFCEWTDECHTLGGGLSVSDCTRYCTEGMSQESSACRSAYDDFGTCLAASGSCTPTECETEAEAMSQHCDDDF